MNFLEVRVLPIDFDKGSTLHIVQVERRDVCCFVGLNARQEANSHARNLECEIYDAIDIARRAHGLVRVSRPNVYDAIDVARRARVLGSCIAS